MPKMVYIILLIIFVFPIFFHFFEARLGAKAID